MSVPNWAIQRGLAGIKGLNFSYRLNTWGPKEGPPMIPANAFAKGMIAPPALSGLKSFFTSVEGMMGIEAPADMVTDAQNSLNTSLTNMTGTLTTIQNLVSQAGGYSSSNDQNVLGKSNACQAEGAGLVSTYQTLQTAAQNLQTSITTAAANPSIDKPTAQGLKDAASAFSDQVSAFLSGVSQLQKDVSALQSAAQSGPGLTGALENTVASSVSTLTWIVGGGLMVYLLLPSFLPRLARGVRKAA